MPPKASASEIAYFLGFDGGGTKTECVLADAQGEILARAIAGPSNPLRTGYTRAWFSLSEAADVGAEPPENQSRRYSRQYAPGWAARAAPEWPSASPHFFERSFPNARVRVTTDLEIALEAAFGAGEGIILLAGTGSAAFGRDANGRTARAGGRGPWFSDEGSAFDIGRRAFAAVARAEEHRGAGDGALQAASRWHQAQQLGFAARPHRQESRRCFSADISAGRATCRQGRRRVPRNSFRRRGIARRTRRVRGEANSAGATGKFRVAKAGGVYGRSKYFDAADRIRAEESACRPRAWFRWRFLPRKPPCEWPFARSLAKGNAA